METNEEIEMLLWEYVDGTCNEADRQRISILIAGDAAWKRKYEELSALHAGIADHLQLEQPSMRFTKNVMEAVAATHIAPATKQYINKSIIRGIAAFFIIGITALLGYAFATADWSVSSTSTIVMPKMNLSQFHIDKYLNSSTFSAIIAINVLLALVLLDSYLRRKRDLSPTLSEGKGDVK